METLILVRHTWLVVWCGGDETPDAQNALMGHQIYKGCGGDPWVGRGAGETLNIQHREIII